jgi:mannan endo-1,4-beta-mannosidase
MSSKSKLNIVCVLLLIAGIAQVYAQGFSISGRNLIDANGNTFILRGVSHAHCWYTDKTTQAIADIKAVGANCVRVVVSNGRDGWTKTTASDLANIINLCKQNKLICIPELHDTTGYGEQSGAITLSAAADYWNSVKSALTGQEAYVIIDIGNEPYGNTNAGNWVADIKAAIQKMRNNGFTHTLIVDATNWGQDYQFYMRDNAQAVFDSDSRRNTLLTVHMYGVFDTAAEIQSYIDSFKSKNLPLAIGEFGHNHSDGNPDEDTIMSYAQSQGVGWMGWSWCGNSSDVAYLDMVNSWNRSSPTSWGTRLFTGANGLSSTSKECTVFGSATNPPTAVPTATPTAGPTATPVSNCLVMGDVNGSGARDIVDALLLAQYYVGLNPANFNVSCADVNCSGSIDIVDALILAQCYVGLNCNICTQ